MTVVLIVVAAVVAGIAALVFLAWFLGWHAEGARAAATEAGERTADGIAEFWDWLRLGR